MLRRIALAFALALFTLPAIAQGWVPDRPVRIIVPFPPGGASDLVARILADRASRIGPQPWVVENRSGANGNIGMEAVARSAPDGYTLGQCTIGNCAINAAIYARMPYDIGRDLVPVYWSGSVMNALAIHPSIPVTNVQEFIAWARANQGRVNYGSSGFGSSNHLTPEFLNGRLGLGLVHVPFRGGAPALQALLANQVQVMIENVPTKIQAIRAGQIRAIAVTGRERDPTLPDVPTFAEAGIPDIVVEPWFGFMAPRGTPAAAVDGLNRILNEANADPEVQRRLRDLGVRPEGGPPARFAEHVRAEVARWGDVVAQNRIEKIE
jgi:tripartite-type tricarboxylate transporter receptor subunit TctC